MHIKRKHHDGGESGGCSTVSMIHKRYISDTYAAGFCTPPLEDWRERGADGGEELDNISI